MCHRLEVKTSQITVTRVRLLHTNTNMNVSSFPEICSRSRPKYSSSVDCKSFANDAGTFDEFRQVWYILIKLFRMEYSVFPW